MSEAELDTNARTDVSYYLELKKELTALRAWKEKARPYIEERLAFLQNCLEEASGPIDEGFEVELKELEELSELTELLKED